MPTIKVKFTRLGRREAKLLRREREVEAELRLLREARLEMQRSQFGLEVQRLWAEYHVTREPELKDRIGKIIQMAEQEGVELASP